jgi:hypothetical protein
MNYYIMPKNNSNVNIHLQLSNYPAEPYISKSLIFYMNNIHTQLAKIQEHEHGEIHVINKMVNPFEFIHSIVPGSVLSVSKVKPESSIFFELMELLHGFNVSNLLETKHNITIAHFTHNYRSTNYLLNMMREDHEDTIIAQEFNYDILYRQFVHPRVFPQLDLIICEFHTSDYADSKKYTYNMLMLLVMLVKCQTERGNCIIKLDAIIYKPLIEIIYLLSGCYERVYLARPSISNITKGERYLICKDFNQNDAIHQTIEEKIIPYLANTDFYIYSILTNEIPSHLLNKLEETNLIIGQQQLEAYDQIIHIYKNKNRDEKMEMLKRTHIQKCIQWCEKNQLPHNKFIDKLNIFLMPNKPNPC